MDTRKLLTGFAAASMIMTGAASIAHAQGVQPGTVYSLHTAAKGSCPSLDWHLVGGEGGAISGMVAWNNMQSMAQVSGKMNADKSITMMAKEVSGPKVGATAKVTGNAESDGWLLLNIEGSGVKCDGIKVPIWRASGGTQQ